MAESGVKKPKRRRQHSLIDKMKHVTPKTRASAAIFSPRGLQHSTFSTVMPLITGLQAVYVANDNGAENLERFERDTPFQFNAHVNKEFTDLVRNATALEHTKRVFGSQLLPLLALLPTDYMSEHQKQEFLYCLLRKASRKGSQTTPRAEVSAFMNYAASLFPPAVVAELTDLCETRLNTLSHPLSVSKDDAPGEEILQLLWSDPTMTMEWDTVEPKDPKLTRPLMLIERSNHFHYEGTAAHLTIPSYAMLPDRPIPWTATPDDTADCSHFISSGTDRIVLVSVSQTPGHSDKGILVVTAQDSYQLCAPIHWKFQEILLAVSDLLQLQEPCQWLPYHDPDITFTLARFERSQPLRNYQFGILYCKQGQTDFNYMYSNNSSFSADYHRFIDWIGEKVPLRGWKKFAGNLDVKDNRTGTESVYTTYLGMQIMFHVSTMLPYCEGDKQQVERKRFLSNDMTMIIFKEGSQKLDLSAIHSEYNHTFIVIQRVPFKESADQPTFRVEIAYKRDVPSPPVPILRKKNIFRLDDKFRTFLLSKLIHSERKAVRGEEFSTRQQRVRSYLLRHIHDTFDKSN